MRTEVKPISLLLATLVLLLMPFASDALTFRKVGRHIDAEGPIEPGDTARLAAQLQNHRAAVDGPPEVSLNSQGGSLVEGLLLGRFFRERRVSTLVRRSNVCYSACAFAFLGGTEAHAVDTGVGRYLEVGAKLGFHGFSSDAERVVLLNEAFDAARAVYGVLLAYANDMRDIDLSLLSELLSVSPANIRIITTPRELNGLGIAIRGVLPQPPGSWARNACSRHISKVRPLKDGPLHERIPTDTPHVAASTKDQLRQMLLGDRNSVVIGGLRKLSSEDLVELALGDTPEFPVHRMAIVRGGGFYYDYCFAYRKGESLFTLLLDTVVVSFESRQRHGPLGWYPDDAPLWRP